MSVTVKVITKKSWYRFKTDDYALKLQVTHKRIPRYVHLRKYISWDDWQSVKSGNSRRQHIKALQTSFNTTEKKALEVIDSMDEYSFQEFKAKWTALVNGDFVPSMLSAFALFDAERQKCVIEGRISAARNYKYACKSLCRCFGVQDFDLSSLTSDDLVKYDNWCRSKGKSPTTYLALLSAIVKSCIRAGKIPPDRNPFNDFRIKKKRTIKHVMSTSDISKILSEKPIEFSMHDQARDFFLFSYMGEGMNMADILRLKNRDRRGHYFHYIRKKTKDSSGTIIHGRTLILPYMERIIEKWGNPMKGDNERIFDVLSDDMTPEEVDKATSSLLSKINRNLRAYSSKIGLEIKKRDFRFYTARHMFASMMEATGFYSVSQISRMLDHTSTDTTQAYLMTLAPTDDQVKEEITRRQEALGLNMKVA